MFIFCLPTLFSAPSEAAKTAIANLAHLFLQEAGKNK